MKQLTPFNIKLMFAPDNVVRNLRPTTRTDIYDGITSNFNEDGLFSTTTFGRVGSVERDNNFSYIRLNGQIIHPAIFEVLAKLKTLYKEIMMGQKYAIWNPETKDFEVSDMIEGDTGMAFFCRHIHHLEPDKRESKKRNMYVDVFKKYQKECLMHNHLIIPAGLRDLEVDKEGRETQDEINDLYRKLIYTAQSINTIGAKTNDSAVDIPRRNLQIVSNQIYDNLKSRLKGKKGLIQQKWGGRKIVQGTRNVISTGYPASDKLGSPRSMTVDAVRVGLYQVINGASPIVINKIKTRFLDDVFISPTQSVTLIHPKSLKLIDVELDPYEYDKWTTTESLEKKLLGFQDDRLRNKPVTVSGYYLYLVYKKKDTFKIFRDINELPDESMLEDVHPMTWSEFFYLSNYEGWYTDFKAQLVRYPVTGMGSLVFAKIYTTTTDNSEGVFELGDDWNTKVGYAREYPNLDMKATWMNTTTLPFNTLKGLGADENYTKRSWRVWCKLDLQD